VALAVPICQDLLERRLLWLGTDVEFEFASISKADAAKDGYMVPMPFHKHNPDSDPQVPIWSDKVNDPDTAIEYRFECAPGDPVGAPGGWSQRLWRGVPDDWVSGTAWNNLLAGPPVSVFSGLPRTGYGALPKLTYTSPRPPAGTQDLVLDRPSSGNIVLLVNSFLDCLLLNCGTLWKKGGRLADRNQWAVMPYTRCLFRQISDHRTGRPFAEFRARAQRWD
jgi:hypothetical protein